jgi:hypothetical protein
MQDSIKELMKLIAVAKRMYKKICAKVCFPSLSCLFICSFPISSKNVLGP